MFTTSGQMIEKYDAVARQSGARIAIHCGQAKVFAGERGPMANYLEDGLPVR